MEKFSPFEPVIEAHIRNEAVLHYYKVVGDKVVWFSHHNKTGSIVKVCSIDYTGGILTFTCFHKGRERNGDLVVTFNSPLNARKDLLLEATQIVTNYFDEMFAEILEVAANQ